MTPAVECVRRAGIEFQLREFEHRDDGTAFAEEAAARLGVSPERVFKTLVVVGTGGGPSMAAAILPASRRLDLKAAAAALGARKAALAPVANAERATGYVHGGISPFAQKKRLPTLIDESVMQQKTVFVSGGRRGLQIELAPADLVRLTAARTAAIAV